MARNKPRWKKKLGGGYRGNTCKCCGYLDCNPIFDFKTPAMKKIGYRKINKLCIACGNKVCCCKNTNRGWQDNV